MSEELGQRQLIHQQSLHHALRAFIAAELTSSKAVKALMEAKSMMKALLVDHPSPLRGAGNR